MPDPAPQLTHVEPRSRGGQPANQNARKHGIYSRYLPAEKAELLPERHRPSLLIRVAKTNLVSAPSGLPTRE